MKYIILTAFVTSLMNGLKNLTADVGNDNIDLHFGILDYSDQVTTRSGTARPSNETAWPRCRANSSLVVRQLMTCGKLSEYPWT